jgi:uncharacterized protein YbaR (Trm112 family)
MRLIDNIGRVGDSSSIRRNVAPERTRLAILLAARNEQAVPLASPSPLEKPAEIADAGVVLPRDGGASAKSTRGLSLAVRRFASVPHMASPLTISDKTLSILRCPNDGSQLREADGSLVAQINAAIDKRRLVDRTGRLVERSINGGLVRLAGDLLYPIVDQIPVMLYDEAIPLAQLETA